MISDQKPEKISDIDFQFDVSIHHPEVEVPATVTAVRRSGWMADEICTLLGIEDARLIYAVERITSRLKPEDFKANVGRGYYGYEVSKAYLANQEVIAEIERVVKMEPSEAIRYVLEREYDYVLPELQNCAFTVHQVAVADLHLPQKAHAGQAKRSQLYSYYDIKNGYVGMETPIAICEKKSPKYYRVIDGYHRVSGAMYGHEHAEHGIVEPIETVFILVAEPRE
jgi:hypothetical protein